MDVTRYTEVIRLPLTRSNVQIESLCRNFDTSTNVSKSNYKNVNRITNKITLALRVGKTDIKGNFRAETVERVKEGGIVGGEEAGKKAGLGRT